MSSAADISLLIDRVRTEGAESLGPLLQKYANYLRLLATTHIDAKLRARVSPSDIVQETNVDAHRSFATFRGNSEGEFVAWLRTILVHNIARLVERHVLTEKRDVRREVSLQRIGRSLERSTLRLQNLLASREPSPSSHLLERERAVLLADQLAELPEHYRQVILFRNLEGLPFATVARRMDKSEGAVRMMWLRGRCAQGTHVGRVAAMNESPVLAADEQVPLWHGLSEEQQVRLTEILEHCMAALEAGQSIDDAAVAAAHPDLAAPLREHLASVRFLCQASVACRQDITQCPVDTAEPRHIGGYRLLSEIGRGGMGVVYEAYDPSLCRRVALKVLPFASLLDARHVARFRNEAQAAGQLHHPHIVPVYAVGCDRGVHFFAMQLVEGQPLDVAIDELRTRSQQRLTSDLGTTVEASLWTDDSTSPWRSFTTSGYQRDPDYLRTIAGLSGQCGRCARTRA